MRFTSMIPFIAATTALTALASGCSTTKEKTTADAPPPPPPVVTAAVIAPPPSPAPAPRTPAADRLGASSSGRGL